MKKMTICSMIAAALMLSSCATSNVEETATPDATPVEPTETTVEAPNFEGAWTVEEFVKDDAIVTGATADIEIVPTTEGNYKLGGYSGVNFLLASDFNIADGKIAPAADVVFPSTMKAGTPEAMAYETAFLEVMRGTNNIALDGDKLVISNDTATITFVAGAPAAMPIEDTAEEDVPVIEE